MQAEFNRSNRNVETLTIEEYLIKKNKNENFWVYLFELILIEKFFFYSVSNWNSTKYFSRFYYEKKS